ncbi:MAG TPA: hypothetical protein VK660_04140 [Xanthomonadaceae bacterium]|nr:hypothetical protein [Xanthomonadaceae bacterium]
MEFLGNAEAGARVRLLSCGLSRDRFGADKNLQEFAFVDRFRKEHFCGASDVEFR